MHDSRDIPNSKKALKLACVLIAAGNSSRLGHPKQLVRIGKQNLLNRTISLSTKFADKVFCVLGFESEQFQSDIRAKQVESVVNLNWEQGMGTSIAHGVNQLDETFDAVLVMLCDQWKLTEQDILSLTKQWLTHPDKIIASQYPENHRELYLKDDDKKSNPFCESKTVLGAPTIFPRRYFKQLSHLKETGARKLLFENMDELIAVEISNAAFDLDTQEDFNYFITETNDNNSYQKLN